MNGKTVNIRHVANHYYIPMILSGDAERVAYVKHIVQEPSEVAFVNKLGEYLVRRDNYFTKFDWWMFSKLDESLDEVYIPYYGPTRNRADARFKPDFIFWLQKGSDYYIVFVDPKGTEHTAGLRKLDGYRQVFEDAGNETKVIAHDANKVRVFVKLFTSDTAKVVSTYRKYWFDSIEKLLSPVLAGAN